MDNETKPELNRVISSVKSELGGINKYLNDIISPSDTVLASIGGNYKIYDEILRDDQVKSTFQQRLHSVLAAAWTIEPGGPSAEDKAAAEFAIEQCEKLKFDDLTKKMLYCRFYGYSVCELIYDIEDNKYVWKKRAVRDRSRFKFNNKCQLRLQTVNDFAGIPCDEPYFWHTSVGASHDDEPYGLGLAHYLYWPVVFKRGGIKFWMKFIEKFAQPSMLGKFKKGATQEDIDKMLQAMKLLASETGTVIPDDMDIMLLEASRSGSVDYAKLVEVMDKAISKIVVGQTMTTDDGSSQSQANVHMEVRQDLTESDAKIICESFNHGPLKWLTKFNFANAKTPILSRQTIPDEDLDDKVERDTKIFTLGYKPTPEYIEENYGEGWEPDDTRTAAAPKETDKNDFSEFKEALFPDQKELDEALKSISDLDLQEQMNPIIQPILDFAEKNGPEKTLEKMTDIYNLMDYEDLVDQLTQVFFVAETHGRLNASR